MIFPSWPRYAWLPTRKRSVFDGDSRGVQHLLLRFGVIGKSEASVGAEHRQKHELCTNWLSTSRSHSGGGQPTIGAVGKEQRDEALLMALAAVKPNVNDNVIPSRVWDKIVALKSRLDMASFRTMTRR